MKKKKIIIGILSIIGGVFLSVKSFGQVIDPFATGPILQISPRLFVAMLGGLLLALGFQLVLVNLSAAAGISAIGNIRKQANEPSHVDESKKERSDTPLGVKFMSGAGAWAMITTAIALFFASFFAVKLSLIPDTAIGITLGLVIWASFFLVMFYLESRAITWVVGNVFGTAFRAIRDGFSGIASGISGVLGRSETGRAEHVAERTVEKVREEVTAMFSQNNINEKIQDYINKLQPKEPDYDRIHQELVTLINEISVEEHQGDKLGDKEIFLKVAEKQPNISRKDIQKLGNLYDEAKTKARQVKETPGDTMVDKAINAIPGGTALKQQVEEYLRQSEDPNLDPNLLKAELEEIFKHPSRADEILSAKAGSFNKENVLSVVCAQPGVDCNQARKVADKVEHAINQIKAQVLGNQQKVADKSRSLKGQAQERTTGLKEKVAEKKNQLIDSVEHRIQAFFDRVNRPELSYGSLRWDFEKILHDPGVAPEVLRERLNKLDAESMVALLAANKNISREQAEKIVGQYEEAKANVMVKIDQIQNEVTRRMEDAKQYALQQAENTRKTAMAASWWVFGTMVISGLAAVLGGALAY